jgi:hypothetical protein
MTIMVQNPQGQSRFNYMGVLIEYEYVDNKYGECSVIAKYNIEKDIFSFEEVFAC